MAYQPRHPRDEHGQILVLFSLVLVVMLVFAALVVDVGVLRNNLVMIAGTKVPVPDSSFSL